MKEDRASKGDWLWAIVPGFVCLVLIVGLSDYSRAVVVYAVGLWVLVQVGYVAVSGLRRMERESSSQRKGDAIRLVVAGAGLVMLVASALAWWPPRSGPEIPASVLTGILSVFYAVLLALFFRKGWRTKNRPANPYGRGQH
ncbi:hypothetical protein [Kocuria sp. CH-021]|uniref:hypothetical protein n=1 Tax=Kocuria sp. CH-021 TaxID=3406735 RepID=UPI003C76C41C